MPKPNPNYRKPGEGGPPNLTPGPKPNPSSYETPRQGLDAVHFWKAQQPDATAWEKVIGYALPLTYEETKGLTPDDVEKLYREAPDTLAERQQRRS